MTTFDNDTDYLLFLPNGATNLSQVVKIRTSEIVIKALKQVGLLSKVTIAGTAPDDTTILWLDTSTDPDTLRYYTGGSWTEVTEASQAFNILHPLPEIIHDVMTYDAVGDGVTNDRAAFVSADGTGRVLVSAGTYRISTSVTIASDVEFALGASLTIDSGAVVTFSGNVKAPTTKRIFAGSGTVSLAGQRGHIHPEWWGAVADGATRSDLAFEAAIDAAASGGAVIECARGDYVFEGTVTIDKAVSLIGQGWHHTRFITLVSTNLTFFVHKTNYGDIRNLGFDGENHERPQGSSTVTFSTAADTVTWAGHDIPENTPIFFQTTGALPTNVSAGIYYYVINTTTNTFQLSTTYGGSAVDFTGSQSGTHTAWVNFPTTNSLIGIKCESGSGVSRFSDIYTFRIGYPLVMESGNDVRLSHFRLLYSKVGVTLAGVGTRGTADVAASSVSECTFEQFYIGHLEGQGNGTAMLLDGGCSSNYFRDIRGAGGSYGLKVQWEGGPKPPNNNWFVMSIFDRAAIACGHISACWLIEFIESNFTGCLAGSGLVIDEAYETGTLDGVTLKQSYCGGASVHGLSWVSGRNVIVEGGRFLGNSLGSSGAYAGIKVGAGAAGLCQIQNAMCGLSNSGDSGFGFLLALQGYGIQIESGACTDETATTATIAGIAAYPLPGSVGRIMVVGNMCGGNYVAGISGTGAPTGVYSEISNNLGSDPADVTKLSEVRALAVLEASTTVKGRVELATSAETITGTDTARAVTPAGMAAVTATTGRAGLVELATDAEAQTGTDTARAITPANLQAVTATETRAGVVELATTGEAQTGTDTARAVTPAGLASVTATTTRAGLVELATDAEAQAGTDTARAITPANLAAVTATTTRAGVVELATTAEATTGTDTARAVTPAGLAAYAPAATTTAAGKVELATSAETQTGTDTDRAVTPAGMASVTATTTRAGLVELATDAEAQTGTDTARAITPANLQAVTATTTRAGVVELATTAEATTGTDTARAVTPEGLKTVADTKAALAGATFTGAIVTPRVHTQSFTIADDAATSFTPSSSNVLMALTSVTATLSGIFRIRSIATVSCVLLTSNSANLTALNTDGSLAGTTGTDTEFTVRCNSADGKVYLENRRGASVTVSVTVIC